MTARRVVLVRHGETAWNREGRFQGQTDIPLSDVGRGQARALRARLETGAYAHLFDDALTAVVTSDLRRAYETAELAFGRSGRTLHVRPALREFCYGVFEGLTRLEIDERFPGAMNAWMQGDRATALQGGESRAQVHERTHAAVNAFLAEVPHRNVVVVAHGGVMRQLLSSCFGDGRGTHPAGSAAEGPRGSIDRGEPRNLSFANTAMHVVRVEPTAPTDGGAATWTYGGQI